MVYVRLALPRTLFLPALCWVSMAALHAILDCLAKVNVFPCHTVLLPANNGVVHMQVLMPLMRVTCHEKSCTFVFCYVLWCPSIRWNADDEGHHRVLDSCV